MSPSSSSSKSHQAPVLPFHEERGARAGDPPSYELQAIDSGIAAPRASPSSEFTPASSGCATPVAPPRAVTAAATATVAPVHEAVQERRKAPAVTTPPPEDPVQVALALVLALAALLIGAVLVVAIVFGTVRLLRYIFG